jgi:hypothetical protein
MPRRVTRMVCRKSIVRLVAWLLGQCGNSRGTHNDVLENHRSQRPGLQRDASTGDAQGTMTGAAGNWTVHTASKAGCPGIALQVRRDGNNMNGFAETGDMAGSSRLTGTIDANQHFTITMMQADDKGPKGTITGSRNGSGGWLVAQVTGSGCTDGPLKIMTYVPYKG